MSEARRHHAIYPGTFDPVTHGHIDIITRAARLFDHLTIAVAHGDTKTLFDIGERTALLQTEIARIRALTHCQMNVLPFDGLLVDFAHHHGAEAVVRGMRPVSDFEYEFKMAVTNARLAPDIETIFLMASDPHHFTSAQLVREIAHLGGDIRPFTTDHVATQLKKKVPAFKNKTPQK